MEELLRASGDECGLAFAFGKKARGINTATGSGQTTGQRTQRTHRRISQAKKLQAAGRMITSWQVRRQACNDSSDQDYWEAFGFAHEEAAGSGECFFGRRRQDVALRGVPGGRGYAQSLEHGIRTTP